METDSVEYFFIDPSQNVCGNCLRYKRQEEFAEMVGFAYEEQEGNIWYMKRRRRLNLIR